MLVLAETANLNIKLVAISVKGLFNITQKLILILEYNIRKLSKRKTQDERRTNSHPVFLYAQINTHYTRKKYADVFLQTIGITGFLRKFRKLRKIRNF